MYLQAYLWKHNQQMSGIRKWGSMLYSFSEVLFHFRITPEDVSLRNGPEGSHPSWELFRPAGNTTLLFVQQFSNLGVWYKCRSPEIPIQAVCAVARICSLKQYPWWDSGTGSCEPPAEKHWAREGLTPAHVSVPCPRGHGHLSPVLQWLLSPRTCNLLGRNGQRHMFLSSCNRHVPEKLNTDESFIKGRQDTSNELFYKLVTP